MAKTETPEPIKAEIVPSNGIPTPLSVIEMAVKQGASIDTLTKLFELKERAEASEARKSFEEAFAAFQAEAPRLEKSKEVTFGSGNNAKTAYKYTPLDEIAKTLRPVLAKHGLTYKWRQDSDKETITVTCILSKGIHSIENSLSANADPSGSKNAIQAIGSAVSYLRRYTLLGVLGMATGDEDTDGITMSEAADFLAVISESSTIEELKKNYQLAIADGVKRQSPKFLALIFKARQQREAELRA